MQCLFFIFNIVVIFNFQFLIPKSAQAVPASVPKTGQTISYAARDDGDLERGVTWPVQRFSDNGNGTVTDNLTGLIWLRDASCTDISGGVVKTNGFLSWQDALTWSNGLAAGKCGLSDGSSTGDWRLPNTDELDSLVDFGHYDPALPAAHPIYNIRSGTYWSSSTCSYSTTAAWVVSMGSGIINCHYKVTLLNVCPVRSGQVGSLGSLSVTDASGNAIGPQGQGPSNPFSIKVSGYTISGTPITGLVYLYASPSVISKSSVWLSNGVGTADVYLDTVGTGQTITASYQGIRGSSAAFDVTGSVVCQSRLSGFVTDGNGYKVAGATITLNNATSTLLTATSDTNGFYSFNSAPPGKAFFVQATTQSGARSGELTVDLSNTKPVSMDLVVISSNCNPYGLTPILLLPGIMGSTYYNEGMYPLLPSGEPDAKYEKWHIRYGTGGFLYGLHDPLKLSGWRDLIGGFKAKGYVVGCTLFPVPYDWRKPIDAISRIYLEKSIERAKSEAGTQKVNIIAHSMVGLVTRYYIDNHSNSDIDRFAMVGTPNHGSASAYYLWQGGDPRTLDDLTDGRYLSIEGQINRGLKFYETTIAKNYAKMMPNPLLFYSKSRIRSFIQDQIQSARQLMPTYTFLVDDTHSFSLQNGQNFWLNDLNNATNSIDYFAGKGVTAKLFSGNNTDTISMVRVGEPNNLYVDGVPKSVYMLPNGDGTVLGTSLDMPGLTPEYTTGTHASLIGKFKEQLISFMTDPAASASTSFSGLTVAADSVVAPVVSTLGILVQGRVSPLLVDPTGKKSGINQTTGLQENEIANAAVSADQESAGISVENVADGVYTLTLGGEGTEDSWVTVSYMDADATVERRMHHFSHAVAVSFTIMVNAAATERITITRNPDTPVNLLADAIGTSSLVTKLSWDTVSTTGVTGYNVYSRRDDEPFLTLVGTTSGTTYDTADPWAVDDTVMSHLYAITAIKADGTESFLSDMAQNNDRDHDGLTDAEELAAGTDPTKIDTDSDGYSDFEEQQNDSNPLVPTSVPTVTLLITKTGAGIGDVSVANGAVCGTSCEPVFNLNTLVTLTAIPDRLSTFGGWTSCDSIGTNGECNVTMSAFKGVSASFNLAPKAMIGAAGYSLLSDAYTAAGATAEILTLDDVLIGNVTLDQDKAITLRGGWNAAYSARSGFTTLNGTLTIRNGSLQVDGVKVW